MGFGYFINSAQELSLDLIFPSLRKSFSPALLASNLALIDGVRVIVQTLVTPLWGVLADRFTRKWVLAVGTGFWGGLVIFCGLSTTYHQLIISWVIACLGIGCLVPAGFSILADIYGPEERGKSIGILNAIGMLGIVAIGLVAGPLLELSVFGWRMVFFVIGVFSILAGILIAVFVKEPVRGGAEPELSDVITELATSRFRFKAGDILEVFKSKTIWVAFIQGLFIMTAMYLLIRFFTTWLVDDRGLREDEAPMLVGVIVIGLAIGSVVGGLVSDWSEKRFQAKGRTISSQFSIVIEIPSLFFLLNYAHSIWSIICFSFIVAFFIDWTRRGTLQPMIQNVMKPELRGTALALAEFFQGGLASVLIMALGKLADRAGLTKTLLYGGCGSLTIGLFFAFLFYFFYPKEYASLRDEMTRRRDLLSRDR